MNRYQIGGKNKMDNTTSTTTSTSYTYTPPSPKYQSEKGWECPRCGRINATWVRQCDCNRNWSITWTDNTSEDEWWKKYSVKGDSDVFKIHPDDITYTFTTAPDSIPTVGGSDYWDDAKKIWSNILKNVSNTQSNKVNPNSVTTAWNNITTKTIHTGKTNYKE